MACDGNGQQKERGGGAFRYPGIPEGKISGHWKALPGPGEGIQ